jgi:hypothetical protein
MLKWILKKFQNMLVKTIFKEWLQVFENVNCVIFYSLDWFLKKLYVHNVFTIKFYKKLFFYNYYFNNPKFKKLSSGYDC